MIVAAPLDAKISTRFAEPPWNEHSEPWLELDAQLPPDHLARDIRGAMTHLDLTPLYLTYGGRGKAPHPPDLMLAIVLFEQRRGQRKPSQWYRDTQENVALWWLGFGIRPSRSGWYEFRDRIGGCLDTLNTTVLHQAVAEELTTAKRGALGNGMVKVSRLCWLRASAWATKASRSGSDCIMMAACDVMIRAGLYASDRSSS